MENTLYSGDKLDMPPIRQVDKTLKKAERFRRKRDSIRKKLEFIK